MQVTAEQQKEWNEYDYGHLKAIRELGIDATTLPNEIKARIRGFNLGLKKINSPEGFNKLITQSAALGDDIITWHEREAKEEEPVEQTNTETTTASTESTTSSTESSSASAEPVVVASGTSAPAQTELTEEEVLAQHSGKKPTASNSSNDGAGFFGWDDDDE